MELDKALQFAVIVAWDDLMKGGEPCSVRVEYQGKPGICLDSVSVWSVKDLGLSRSAVRLLDVGFFGPPQRGLLQGRTQLR